MNKITENIRYGSLVFLYLISTAFIFNITPLTDNYISFISFTVFSLILCLFSRITDTHLIKVLNIAALMTGITLEFYCILNIFRYTSDNNNSLLGSIVFALVILTVSFLASSKSGIYSLLKASNIIFFLPLIPFLILPVFFVLNSPYTSAIFKSPDNSQALQGILDGAKGAILLFSDFSLINIMQKREKCYTPSSSTVFCFFVIAIIALTNIIYRLIFGVNITGNLISPIFSSLSVIGRLGLDEIVSFIFSICFLFRLSCKITIILSLLRISEKKSIRFLLTALATIIFALVGTLLIYKKIIDIKIIFNITVVIYFISYVLSPIMRKLFSGNRKDDISSTEFATKK